MQSMHIGKCWRGDTSQDVSDDTRSCLKVHLRWVPEQQAILEGNITIEKFINEADNPGPPRQ